MTDFRERYKRAGYGREDADMNRALRSQRRDEARREARSQHLSQHRDMNMHELQDDTFEREEEEERQREQQQREHEAAESKSETELDAGVQKRLLQLEKWREERNRKKLQEKKKAKPVFKVGVVHHKVYSPPLNKEPVPLPPAKLCKSKEVPFQSPPPKRVTRATEKRLAVKAITNQQKRAITKKKRENQPVKQHADNDGNKQAWAPLDHQFKVPLGIMAIPMFGRHGLGAKENILPMLPPNEIFNDAASTSSSAGRSFIISKSSNLSPDLRKSSIHSRDSLNSSGEAFVLRMSSGDQEMLDGNDINNPTNCQSPNSKQSGCDRKKSSVNAFSQDKDISKDGIVSTSKSLDSMKNQNAVNYVTKKSSSFRSSSSLKKSQTQLSRKISPPQEVTSATDVDYTSAPEEQEVSTCGNQAKLEKSPHLSTRPKRCTRQMSNKSTVSDDISTTGQQSSVESNQDASQVSEENQTQQMDVDGENMNFFINDEKECNSSKRNVLNSLDTEEDLRRLSNCVVQVDKNEVEFELSKSHQTIISPDKADPKVLENGKEKLHRRRSVRSTAKVNDVNEKVESPDTTDVDQPPQVQRRVVYNLMDSTLSDLNGLTNRKSTRITTCFSKAPENAVEQSLIKFSPRHSTIVQLAQNNDDKLAVSSSTHLSPKTSTNVDDSLVKFSPLLERTSTRLETLTVPDSAQKSSDGGNSSIDSSLDDKPPAFFSPFIVTSRGKTSARKETKRRRFSQASPEDIPTKDTVMLNSTVSPEEEERTAQYYKYLLDKEIERLNECCNHWNSIKEDNTLPEDVHYMIQAAVGQTQLLINKKFQRFRGLVLDCETGKGEMLVTCKDLQGFWEMMYMEVKNCEGRFEKLDELKTKNWVEDEPEDQPKAQPKKVAKKPVAKKKAVANKPSSLRAHIMAARKKKMESQDSEDAVVPITEEKRTESEIDCEKDKVDTETISKSRRTSTPKSTSKWQDLMNKMQKSQNRKTTSSPLVVMKLSQMCKTPEVQMDESIVYINSNRTPAKSILKTSKDETLGSVSKSTYKVNFREQPMEYQEFDPESRVNNDADYDTEDTDQEKEPIERRLNFESDSFNCSADKFGFERETLPVSSNYADSPFPSSSSFNGNRRSIPNIVVDAESPLISMSPLSLTDTKPSSSMKKPGSAKKKKQITFQEDSEKSSRSRKFSVPLTPIPRSTSIPLADEGTGMEVDDDRIRENLPLSSKSIPEKTGVEEIYLNEHGIVSTRIVPAAKNTPTSIKLKRSNSERLQQCTRSLTKMEGVDSSVTPKSRKRSVIPEIKLCRPDTPVVGNAHENEEFTPTVERNAKRSYADITLTEENVGEVSTPKVRRKISKISHSPLCDIDQDEDVQRSVKSVRRTKSLNLKPSDILEKTNEPTTPQSKNTTIHLDGSSIRDKYVRKTPRSNAIKNLKKLQENLDPNEHDLSLKEEGNMELSRTPSLKRKSSKEPINSDQQTDGHEATKDLLTPNGRRKSLRIARTNSRKEN